MSNRRRLVALALLPLAAAGIAACQPTSSAVVPPIAGVSARFTPAVTGERGDGSYLDLTMTTARTLTVSCTGADRLVVNGTVTGVVCTQMAELRLTGSSAADQVTIELSGALSASSPYTDLRLGGGADRATVRSHGQAVVDGGDGDDALASQHLLPYGTAGRYRGVIERTDLVGGPGVDTLTNLGFGPGTLRTGGEPIDYYGLQLDGGLGADIVHGDPTRPDLLVTDGADTLDLQSGPGTVTLVGSAGADTVVADLNGNYGPKGTITTGSVTRSFSFPTETSSFVVNGAAGNDTITISHRSSHAGTYVQGGDGTDRLTVQPSLAAYQAGERSVTQPDPWLPVTWGYDVEASTVQLVARP